MDAKDKSDFRLLHVTSLETTEFKYKIELWTLKKPKENAATPEGTAPESSPAQPAQSVEPAKETPSAGLRRPRSEDSEESEPALCTMPIDGPARCSRRLH